MMDSQDPRLDRLVGAVVDAFHPLAIYLFGSRARGDHHPQSDYDLMVVLDDDAPEDLLDRDFAFDVGLAAQVPADIIPTTKTPFLQRKGRLYTMAGHVHRDGKLVYGSLR